MSSGPILHVCPTDVVRASAPRIWRLLTTPDELARWSDTTIVEAPHGTLDAGDRLVLGVGLGPWMRVVLTVQEALAPRRLTLRIRLPLGVVNDEVIEIVPLDDMSARVTFG